VHDKREYLSLPITIFRLRRLRKSLTSLSASFAFCSAAWGPQRRSPPSRSRTKLCLSALQVLSNLFRFNNLLPRAKRESARQGARAAPDKQILIAALRIASALKRAAQD
jgi:hypothetical protein